MAKALYYVKGKTIFKRPVQSEKGATLGFAVCDVRDDVDPIAVCEIMNLGDPDLSDGR